MSEARRSVRFKRRAKVLAIATVLGVAAACMPAAPGTSNGLGRVSTLAETNFGMFIERDCGYSRKTRDATWNTFWVFCDTTITQPGPAQLTSFRGSAALGQIPGTLPALPAQFGDIPSPGQSLLPAGGYSCPGGGQAGLKWVSGLSPVNAQNEMVIFYSGICGSSLATLKVGGWGGAVYDFDTHSITSDPGPVFSATGSSGLDLLKVGYTPVESGNYWYFYGTGNFPTGGGSANLMISRVPKASWRQPSAYQWWWGDGWTSTPVPVVSGPLVPNVQVSADYYPSINKVVVMVPKSLSGTVDMYEAPLSTPWSLTLRYSNVKLPACANAFCYHVIGHPELSSGTELAISFFDTQDSQLPAGSKYGHVNMIRFGWTRSEV